MIPAKSETVDLYRLLYKADHPMSLEEIAGTLGGMNPVYKTFANKAYTEHLAEEQRNKHHAEKKLHKATKLGGVKEYEAWSEEERHAAWVWWLSGLLKSMRETKRISVTHKDGSSAQGGRYSKEAFYAANRDNAPAVRRRVDAYRVVSWAPELDKVTDRHVAGMQFLQQVDTLLKERKLPPDVKKALNLAAQAIRE